MPWAKENLEPEPLLTREWLVANGIGGYASGTVGGACTRRFHGYLVAALPSPIGRVLMLNHLAEEVRLPDGRVAHLGGDELEGGIELHGMKALVEFRLETGLPVWRYQVDGIVFEKTLVMPHRQNTVFVLYRLLEGPARVRLRVRPSMHFRPHEARVDRPLGEPYAVTARADLYEIRGDPSLPPLRLAARGEGASFVLQRGSYRDIVYRVEARRGYDSRGTLWSPGYFRAELRRDLAVSLLASTEDWDTALAMDAEQAHAAEVGRRGRLLGAAQPEARSGFGAELVLAADQFIITPGSRPAETARAHAAGDEVRTVIAGYPWFTDWGRDTMISLEGLTLATGRREEAGYLVRTFSHYVREGLIPNLFPESGREALYHAADATLWYFHAIDRYLAATGDRRTLRVVLPVLFEIMERHSRGTRFGIGMDPEDGLLRQGVEQFPLTWMDARVDGWVVTPRRGKTVEVNALWYNALRLMERWARDEDRDEPARVYGQRAELVRASFNRRFWCAEAGCLYDVVDGEKGDDPAVRPNQLLAFSLPHEVLEPSRWSSVLDTVERELVTPYGLRSLARAHPDYRERYDGDLRSRDAAYHQGTVWAWLIGPFIDAWLKVHPDRPEQARKYLGAFGGHLGEACMGTISEIFDAEEPFTPRGCVAQAWSVAEALRAWVKTAPRPVTVSSPSERRSEGQPSL
ncbi:MAG: glycogen debranching enzyme family protein [Elusimicrobia bacterium]|nr:glycogen debranching enzyme family protein [Elusimicrobiota bacterium]